MSRTDNKFKNICRDWASNKGCSHNPCKFIHDPDLCVQFYKIGKCDGLCEKNHFVNPELSMNNNYKVNKVNKSNYQNHYKKPTNTESFEPDYTPPEMRVRFEFGKTKCELDPIQSNDIIVIPDLFANEQNLYNKLLEEVFATNFNKQDLIIPWHEGCHLIVDDHMDWKKSCPTFTMVIDRIAKYFDMDIKATRFNWYQKKEDWKAFHYDSAAIDQRRAQTQNFTVGVSFGATREIAFQVASHPTCRNVVSFPMNDGCTFCFSKDVNIDWRHGILPIKTEPEYKSKPSDGRISIIAWGQINQINLKPNNKII